MHDLWLPESLPVHLSYSCRQGRHGEAGCARPSVSSLSIPRLRKADKARSTEAGNSGLVLLHYTGKKQVNPPAVPLVTSGPSYADVERTTLSLSRAQENDTQWLKSLFRSSALNPPMEWGGGFNSQLARQSTGCNKREPSMYLFGPLINAPPAHVHRRTGRGAGGSPPPPIRAVCRHEFGQRGDIIRAKHNTCLNNT